MFFISGICFVLTFLSVSVCAFDNATTERAIDVLQTLQIINEDYATSVDKLIQAANDRGGNDNITALVIKL